MKRKYDLYLKDIITAIDKVKEYTKGLSLEQFDKDNLVKDAVLRNLEIIGEAVAQLQEDIKDKYDDIPWRKIKDFRNVVAHRYWKVNRKRVWDIIQNKLEPLKTQVNKILEEKNSEKNS